MRLPLEIMCLETVSETLLASTADIRELDLPLHRGRMGLQLTWREHVP